MAHRNRAKFVAPERHFGYTGRQFLLRYGLYLIFVHYYYFQVGAYPQPFWQLLQPYPPALDHLQIRQIQVLVLAVFDIVDLLGYPRLLQHQNPVDLVKGAPGLSVVVTLNNLCLEFDPLDNPLRLPEFLK